MCPSAPAAGEVVRAFVPYWIVLEQRRVKISMGVELIGV